MRRLRKGGVEILTNQVIAIEAGRLVYEPETARLEMAVDRVALAVGWRPRGRPACMALDGREVLVVGDADHPADFVAAVGAGGLAALQI